MKRVSLLLASVIIFFSASSALAARHYVANNGLDESGCGLKSEPCRSISFAVDGASSGDVVIVGPGVYGDINDDGDLDDEGEETALAANGAMISFSKSIKLISRDGARATLIRGLSTQDYVLYLKSSEVVLGRKNRGFSIHGGSRAAVFVEGSKCSITSCKLHSAAGYGLLAGCIPSDDPDYFGAPDFGKLKDSILNHNNLFGAYLCDNTEKWKILKSEFSYNVGGGLTLKGPDHVGNNISVFGNDSRGLTITDAPNVKILKSIISANDGLGASVGNSENATFKSVSIIGNSGAGIFYGGTDQVFISNSNVYGNQAVNKAGGLDVNCGVFDNMTSEEVQPDDNYWGTDEGPSYTEPADSYCSQVKNTFVNSYLKKEKRIRTAQPKQ